MLNFVATLVYLYEGTTLGSLAYVCSLGCTVPGTLYDRLVQTILPVYYSTAPIMQILSVKAKHLYKRNVLF